MCHTHTQTHNELAMKNRPKCVHRVHLERKSSSAHRAHTTMNMNYSLATARHILVFRHHSRCHHFRHQTHPYTPAPTHIQTHAVVSTIAILISSFALLLNIVGTRPHTVRSILSWRANCAGETRKKEEKKIATKKIQMKQ